MLEGKNIAIIGLGLMGGALAMGLRRQEPAMIGAFDLDGEVLERALEAGDQRPAPFYGCRCE